ncbi:MAG TPA: fumarylacetoacetate hydrolase family protein [Plantibacter sp.]|uniref:fumarylacetoacetate hydrolase family protein n=1 Tax=unclassified Plantibacter TaxID=2624265 RepID=UPI002CF03956|nr:fumarylacetoacetate hydrolase family protein [Plantibacter sp.]
MRIARISTPTGPQHAIADSDDWALVVDPFVAEPVRTGETVPMAGAQLLAPVEPRVLVGIAHNLTNNHHALPIQAWLKSPHSVTGPGESIVARGGVGTVNIEGELAVVIGAVAEGLTLENALDVVLGYTIVNDVTNVDRNAVDEKNFEGKGGTNYTPLGPWIETQVADPDDVATSVVVNGVERASSGSFNLPSSVAATLVYVSAWVTLHPGDVVMTGAPNTFVAVEPGDRVDITLAGLGTLSNPVAAV